MGIDEEKIDEIIAMHTETTSGLKEEAAKYKEDAEKLAQTAKDLEKTQKDLEAEKKSGWKEKYDSLKTEYENYKTEQANREAHSAKEAAYKELLKEAGVSEKRITAILKVSDIDGIELDDAGTVRDSRSFIFASDFFHILFQVHSEILLHHCYNDPRRFF